jgi:hypothetical protein
MVTIFFHWSLLKVNKLWWQWPCTQLDLIFFLLFPCNVTFQECFCLVSVFVDSTISICLKTPCRECVVLFSRELQQNTQNEQKWKCKLTVFILHLLLSCLKYNVYGYIIQMCHDMFLLQYIYITRVKYWLTKDTRYILWESEESAELILDFTHWWKDKYMSVEHNSVIKFCGRQRDCSILRTVSITFKKSHESGQELVNLEMLKSVNFSELKQKASWYDLALLHSDTMCQPDYCLLTAFHDDQLKNWSCNWIYVRDVWYNLLLSVMIETALKVPFTNIIT